ncbi:MAG: hypothetical protein A2Y74_01475 [Actinobacteria bacterium RBG_13_63_9]|nr:MAG: hypothetical protein A2Y74_01475 [Actinobacteria bacterium RBG_13_63_9]
MRNETRKARNQRRADRRLELAYKAWQLATNGGRKPTPKRGQTGYLSPAKLILLGIKAGQ